MGAKPSPEIQARTGGAGSSTPAACTLGMKVDRGAPDAVLMADELVKNSPVSQELLRFDRSLAHRLDGVRAQYPVGAARLEYGHRAIFDAIAVFR